MFSRWLSVVHFSAALGSGLVAGVFFAFSSFVLPALARLPQPQGVAAMQAINVTVINRSFLGAFLGTALCCALLCTDALLRWSAPGAKLRLVGGALYLLGSLLVTLAGNVPYNDALARLLPQAAGAADAWQRFVAGWSFWNHVRTVASFGAAALLVLALSGCSRNRECAPPDTARLSQLPNELSKTGIDGPDVREFRPRFELWSDGAAKRRFIQLPPGEPIDTSDMDSWVFPAGTQLWKEFTVNGVRVETRLLRKIGAGSDAWLTQTYLWKEDGSDAVAAPGGKSNALGTEHDLPGASECLACHGGRESFVLGFSAVQLSYEATPGQLDMRQLIAERLITRAPSAELIVPGDATARAALGYVHGNCAHCHNQSRPAAARSRCYDPDNSLDFWLKTSELGSVESTATYRSGLGKAFELGDPEGSRMLELMSTRGFLPQMPPLGTEQVDARALAVVTRWISEQR
jgi:uncharacterized membrane protein